MLTLEDVRFGYGDRKILDGITVRFPDRGLVILLGASGSGKTTLLSLCCSSLRPDSGTITRIPDIPPARVYQSPLLLDYLTVLENVLLPLRLSGEGRKGALLKAKESLARVGLSGKEEQDVRLLSGGEQMRVFPCHGRADRTARPEDIPGDSFPLEGLGKKLPCIACDP